jgi:hypothetical protein
LREELLLAPLPVEDVFRPDSVDSSRLLLRCANFLDHEIKE